MIDTELFDLAVKAALRIPSSGIGTLSEKKVHAALKYYVQPDMEKHEIKTCGFVCDALSEDGVYEIQTRGFYRLNKKLDALLNSCTVTVVYPIISEKVLYLTDADSGEVTVRKSPKKMSLYTAFDELYRIRKHLTSERLRVRMITLSAEEYRTVKKQPSAKRRAKKLTTVSAETVPTEIFSDITLKDARDYAALLPDALPETFTSADLAGICRIHRTLAATMLLILTDLSAVERIGKKGNSYVYKRCV